MSSSEYEALKELHREEVEALRKKLYDRALEIDSLKEENEALRARLQSEERGERGAFRNVRGSPKFPVAAPPSIRAEREKEREKLSAERSQQLLPGGALPESVQIWVDEKFTPWQEDDEKFKKQGAAVIPWLIDAIASCHLDEAFEDAVKKLFKVRKFTLNLGYMEQWDPLRAALSEKVEQNSRAALEVFEKNNLGLNLSDEEVRSCWTKHPEVPKEKKDLSQCIVFPELKSGGKSPKEKKDLSQCIVFPELKSGGELLDYNSIPRMDEQVALIAMLLVATAINNEFLDRVHAATATLVQQQDSPPPKGFPRANVKAKTDYRSFSKPRTGKCTDLIRVLLRVVSPYAQLEVIKALSKEFNGLCHLKNPFSLSVEKRASMGHLLITNITLIFNSTKTFGELLSDQGTLQKWEAFRGVPQGEPRERWERQVDLAIKFLSQKKLQREQVRLIGEVQIVLEDFHLLRHDGHHLYKVVRASNQGALYDDYAGVSKVTGEDANTLYSAAKCGQLDVATRLLNHGADINYQDSAGITPLYIAVQEDHADLVEMLITKGADLDKARNNGETPLWNAAAKGHTDIMELLVTKGADLNKARNDGVTPLFMAAVMDHTDIVELLVTKGADPDKARNDGTTPLSIAALNGHTDIVELLITKGADPDKVSNDAIMIPLYIAAAKGYTDIVELLVTNNADVNKVNQHNRTALHTASSEGHVDIVNILIKWNADLNIKGEWGTPLQEAIDDEK
eukprot:CAMPEP_0194348694 /NCGR_PEP_ID=MMETSP0171-20130528/106672_1 /TAXON_ID=218684 /ORGANISM="Corethron pennatum, Strain L29A3" /LENGTH=737 /DNA_ID=CAMNT_0039116055 /DNA_START=64 /DNA_END=2273 /DNA_ORIENTATION=+